MQQELHLPEARSPSGLKRQIQSVVRRRFPALWQARAYRRYLTADWGEREIHVLAEVVPPDRWAVDVGVFEGIYARRLAQLCRGVFGFEANPESAAFCRAALGRTVTIRNCALSDRDGVATLRLPVAGEEAALATVAPANDLGGRAFREVSVPTARLDDFDLPPAGFVKIDVEGHEEAVLRGAAQTIARDRPALMIEIEERHNPGGLARIFAALAGEGFRARRLVEGRLRDAPRAEELAARTPGAADYINNVFFIPEERAQGG